MTTLDTVLDIDLLNNHLKNGLVKVVRHPNPSFPLRLFNYTHLAQAGGPWGDGTLDFCRGLIVDEDNNIVARPFKKFHNLNTSGIPETWENNLPNCQPTVTEKLDGSLGILWRWRGYCGVATRGSFTSPQAFWASDWLQRRLPNRAAVDAAFPLGVTPLFEILYKENRIVCEYETEECVLLGLVENSTGAERHYGQVVTAAALAGMRAVKLHDRKTLAECAVENVPGREGYVLSYATSAWEPPVKVKVKFEDYVRLHRLVTNLTPRRVWEVLSAGQLLDTTGWPEHAASFVNHWKNVFLDGYREIAKRATAITANRPLRGPVLHQTERAYRKEVALYFKREGPDILPVLFAMLDGDDFNPIIWKQLDPKNEKVFREDGE